MNPKIFFGELKRRNVYKVAVAYAVVGWLLIQVATQVFPFLEIPNWAIRLVILLTAFGFPVALIIAWAFELTPEGVKRTEAADAARQHSRGGDLDRRCCHRCGAFVRLVFPRPLHSWRATPRQSEAAIASNAQKSIAVLPLVNTSGDPSNEYFSDGLSEELIAVLAKIPELKVIGRSSSFFFKGKSGDSAAIGQEARCRQSDRRQRAQAGRSCSHRCGAHQCGRWPLTLVGNLRSRTERCVRSPGRDCQIGCGADEGEVVRRTTTVRRRCVELKTSPPIMRFCRRIFISNSRPPESVRQRYHSSCEEAVRLDPNYALAYAKLAQAWRQYAASFRRETMPKAYDEARRAADKAVSLAPDLAEVRMAVGFLAMTPDLDFPCGGKRIPACAGNRLPTTPLRKAYLGVALSAQGRLTEAEQTCREALSLDPLVTASWYNIGRVVVGIGPLQGSRGTVSQRARDSATRFTFSQLPRSPGYSSESPERRRWPTPDWRRKVSGATTQSLWCSKRRATDLRPMPPSRISSPRDSNGGAFQIAVLYAVRKEPDEMFKWLDTAYATHDSGLSQLAVTPFFLPYVNDPRFTALCQKLNVQVPSAPAKQ